jgi:nitroreductase
MNEVTTLDTNSATMPLPTVTTHQPPVGVSAAIHGRRSVRDFTSTHVDEKTIRALLDAAVQAPTAVHEEPWCFVIVQDAAVLRRISDRAKGFWLEHLAAGAPAPRADTPPAGLSALARRLADPEFSIFYNAGTLVVIAAKPLGPFVTADCWLAAENLMLAACAMGLGTCCIGLAVPAMNTAESKAELGLAHDVHAVAAIIVGVPSGAAAPVPRKDPLIVYWG